METKKEDKKVPKKNYKKPKDSVIIPIKKEMDRNEIIERNEKRSGMNKKRSMNEDFHYPRDDLFEVFD